MVGSLHLTAILAKRLSFLIIYYFSLIDYTLFTVIDVHLLVPKIINKRRIPFTYFYYYFFKDPHLSGQQVDTISQGNNANAGYSNLRKHVNWSKNFRRLLGIITRLYSFYKSFSTFSTVLNLGSFTYVHFLLISNNC